MAPAQGAPLQLSQAFSLPRKHFTNDTLDNRSSSESPATQGAGGLGKSLSTGKGRWQLGARDTASLWSLGMIQVLAFSPLLRRGLAWWWVLASQPAQDLCGCLSFARLAGQSLFLPFLFPIPHLSLSPSILFSFIEHLLCTEYYARHLGGCKEVKGMLSSSKEQRTWYWRLQPGLPSSKE